MENTVPIPADLRNAFTDGNLALYLGAGVSVGSGLPSWNQLVLALYYAGLSQQSIGRPYANYLFAIAEWQLKQRREPLEITARKARMQFTNDADFLNCLRLVLYAGGPDRQIPGVSQIDASALRSANPTLDAVASLCDATKPGSGCVRCVVTYNYDALLEMVTELSANEPVWRAGVTGSSKIPIYHVHGYVPLQGQGSAPEEIIFTEEQYHVAGHDPYSWSNLVQIQTMSNCVGLMIGLSLTDPNMRRLLDAIRKLSIRPRNFALLQRPKAKPPAQIDFQRIHESALRYLREFERGGLSRVGGLEPGIKGSDWKKQVQKIIQTVDSLDRDCQTRVLRELGVEPIWYDDHAEIPNILAGIRTDQAASVYAS